MLLSQLQKSTQFINSIAFTPPIPPTNNSTIADWVEGSTKLDGSRGFGIGPDAYRGGLMGCDGNFEDGRRDYKEMRKAICQLLSVYDETCDLSGVELDIIGKYFLASLPPLPCSYHVL